MKLPRSLPSPLKLTNHLDNFLLVALLTVPNLHSMTLDPFVLLTVCLSQNRFLSTSPKCPLPPSMIRRAPRDPKRQPLPQLLALLFSPTMYPRLLHLLLSQYFLLLPSLLLLSLGRPPLLHLLKLLRPSPSVLSSSLCSTPLGFASILRTRPS